MIGDLPSTVPAAAAESTESDPKRRLYELETLRWVAAAVADGEAILKDDPSYEDIDRAISYVMGDQVDQNRPTTLSGIADNRFKNIVLQTVAALTDLHPVFGFQTYNQKFKEQSDTLDKLTRAWWIQSFSDLRLADTIRYATVCGTGYAEVIWNAAASGGAGDIELIPRDPRDVLPIRPTLDHSLQTWEGVIIRSSKSINEMRARFPEKANVLIVDRHTTSTVNRLWRKARSLVSRYISPAVDHVTAPPKDAVARVPSIDVFTIHVKDRRILDGQEPITMGDPKTTWCYTVYPVDYLKPDGKKATEDDARLYPRGRMIIATRTAVLYDGPNPYWHGMFPIVKLCLDPWPWTILGAGLSKDLMPLQDAVNEIANGILDHVRKVLRPPITGDKKVVPESVWQRLDTRIPGMKIRTNSQFGTGVEIGKIDPLPPYVFEFYTAMTSEMDWLAGVANLTALSQLNQTPGADSIEKMMEALTPILRLKGRLMEGFLRELGEMVKCNFFQFYTLPRRLSILGDSGINFQDFDFDPGTLIPSMAEGEEGYDPAYDAAVVSRADRAKHHMRNFTFQITPNSVLAMSQMSRKLMYLQLWRGGIIDPWTLFEVLEIPNGGQPPDGALTITERLIAAQMIGLTGAVSPAGRKASGQEGPSMQVKKDDAGLPRVTVSESGSGGG